MLILTAALASCSGLAGEPQIVATLIPSTPIPAPSQAPDIALGAQVYAANCTRCHGDTGAGDGEFVLSGQIQSPGDFTNPASFSDQRPVDFYSIITNGNLNNGMPPWINALSEQERWSVAYYTYTLGLTQAQIAHGSDLVAANCAECDLSSLSSLDANAGLSRTDLISAVGNLSGFTSVSADDRVDVAAYVRTLALDHADAVGSIAPASTPEPTVAGSQATAEAEGTADATAEATAAFTGTVSGQISNGTAGSSTPADLPMTLFMFDAQFNQQQINTMANADGSYQFDNVPLDPSYTYVVTTNYRDRVFASDILSGDTLSADLADDALVVPLTIYELTEDPDVIEIGGMVTQVTVNNGNLEVAQVFNVTNTSDRAYTTTQTTDDGTPISLAFTLPPGAVIAGFPADQNRYVVDAANSTFFDTVPVLPDEEHIVQVIYLIQYDQGAIIEQELNYALNGPVRLLLTPESVSVTSDQYQSLGAQTVGGTSYQSYGGQLTLPAGSVLSYTLSGAGINAAAQGDRTAPVVTSNNLLVIGGGVLIIIALLGGGLYVIASRSRSGDSQVTNILIRQIAELDAEHDAGKIDDASYESQRSALKARLTALMERKE